MWRVRLSWSTLAGESLLWGLTAPTLSQGQGTTGNTKVDGWGETEVKSPEITRQNRKAPVEQDWTGQENKTEWHDGEIERNNQQNSKITGGKHIFMRKKPLNTTTYIRYIAEAAVIAALYAVLTIVIPGGSGQIQVRVAEALTVLPFFTPAAIPGLFAGCLLANLVTTSAGIYDIIFGSLATLLAAFLTRRMPLKHLASLPPVVINAIAVAFILNATIKAPLLITMGFVALGELIACYGLGYPLMLFLEKRGGSILGK